MPFQRYFVMGILVACTGEISWRYRNTKHWTTNKFFLSVECEAPAEAITIFNDLICRGLSSSGDFAALLYSSQLFQSNQRI